MRKLDINPFYCQYVGWVERSKTRYDFVPPPKDNAMENSRVSENAFYPTRLLTSGVSNKYKNNCTNIKIFHFIHLILAAIFCNLPSLSLFSISHILLEDVQAIEVTKREFGYEEEP